MISATDLKRDGFHVLITDSNGMFSAEQALHFVGRESSGEWFLIVPSGAQFHPKIFDLLTQAAQQRPDLGIFYGDDVSQLTEPDEWNLSLKPDWNSAMHCSTDYVGLPIFIRVSSANRIGAIDINMGSAAVYDLLLRAQKTGVTIGRIPEVLARYPVDRFAASAVDRRAALTKHFPFPEFRVLNGRTADSLRMEKHFSALPDVTLVVPTRQTRPDAGESHGPTVDSPYILRLLESIELSEFPMEKLTVIVGDDCEDDAIYAQRDWPFRLHRIHTARKPDEPFNYAAKMNRLWRESTTESLILLNDDVTVISPDWIQALLSFSTQADVGGVGARLLYPDGAIQHAGIPGGVFGLCTHAWIGQAGDAPTYQDWALLQREWSMVTGAVFATRKSLLEEINGFDEAFRLDFNDIDMCLKLRMLGYRIVYTPHAELVHHEKGSRGTDTWKASELARFLRRWDEFLGDDPAFHPKLSRTSSAIKPAPSYGIWWQ